MTLDESELKVASTQQNIPWVLVLVVITSLLLLISDVNLISALLVVLVISVQTFIGLTVTGYEFNSGKKPNPGRIFFGFFCGTAIHVVSDQILRSTNYRAAILPALAGLTFIVQYKPLVAVVKKWQNLKLARHSFGRTDNQLAFLLLPLIPLCQVWSWTRYSVFAILVGYLIYSLKSKWFKNSFLIAATVVGAIAASQMRPSFWWLPSWGIDENAIYARAIHNWGPKGDVLLSGVPLKYQWFGYSWMGLMSDISASKDFEFVSRTAYVICSVAIVIAVFAITFELVSDYRKSLIATFIVVSFCTAISYPVSYSVLAINYQPFAVVSMLCWILVLVRWIKTPTMRLGIELSLVGVICISAKSVHILPIVIIVALVAFISLCKNDRRMIFGAISTLATSFLYTRYFFPSSQGTGLNFKFAEFTRQFGIAPELNSLKNRILIATIVIISLSFISLILISMQTNSKQLKLMRAPLFAYFCLSAVFAISLERVSSTELHFLQLFVLISLVLFISSLVEILDRINIQRYLPIVVSLVVIIGLVLIANSRTSITNDENYVVLILKANFAISTVLLSVRMYPVFFSSSSAKTKLKMQVALAIMVVSASLANHVFVTSTRDIRPISKVAATYQLGQEPLQEVANWINENTDVDAIVASNLFFGEGGTDYCSVPEDVLMDSIAIQATSTNYYTTPALIHRRFLAAGVLYASITYDGSVLPRVQASLRAACYPDSTSRESLEDFGVDFFIAYRENNTGSTYWNQMGTVVYRNNAYTTIEIKP